MKIIDLLNKIANGEEVPKKIKYINSIWKYDKETKDYFHDNLWLIYSMDSIELTEAEVEILEEPKKLPKKLPEFIHTDSLNYNTCNIMFEALTDKINEILDYLKSKGND